MADFNKYPKVQAHSRIGFVTLTALPTGAKGQFVWHITHLPSGIEGGREATKLPTPIPLNAFLGDEKAEQAGKLMRDMLPAPAERKPDDPPTLTKARLNHKGLNARANGKAFTGGEKHISVVNKRVKTVKAREVQDRRERKAARRNAHLTSVSSRKG